MLVRKVTYGIRAAIIGNEDFEAGRRCLRRTIQRSMAEDIQLKIPHGLGKMYKEDGALFVGRFSHGKAEGEGLYILKDGSYYEGLFKDNVAQCPKGTFCCKDYTYTGAFKNNKFHG